MHIVFNLHNVGLGNNGGSRTLIKCAETLQRLGCEVTLASDINNYSWHPMSVKVTKKIPSCDVIIASGFGSVKSTVSSKVSKKFYYIRGYEKWATSSSELLRSYRSLKCITNSEWLSRFLNKHSIHNYLVYPGLDFDDFYVAQISRPDVIGGLFHKRHKTKRHEDIIAIAQSRNYELVLLNRDIVHPNANDLRQFYNNIKIWVSASELEGLHNCPMEAALCGCALVCTDCKKGGVSDYAIHDKTSFVYPARDIKKASEYISMLLNDEQLRASMNSSLVDLLHDKIGTRKDNMLRLLEIISS